MKIEGATKIRTYRNGFLIYNPHAGTLRAKAGLLDKMVEELRSHGHLITPVATEFAGQATHLSRAFSQQGADLIVAAGGDGTINEVLNGLAGSETPLAMLPVGTANVFSHEIGIRNDWRKAAALVGSGQPTRITLGLVEAVDAEPRHFLLMAGVGFDAAVVRQVSKPIKDRLGKGAYYLAGVGSVWQSPAPLKMSTNGHHRTGTFLLASRVKNYGGDLEIALNANLLDDHLETVMFESPYAAAYFGYLFAVATRQTYRFPGIRTESVKEMRVEPLDGRPVYLQIDGELAGMLPASIRTVPSALTIILPQSYGAPKG